MAGKRLVKDRKVAVLVPGTPGSPGNPGQPYIAGHWVELCIRRWFNYETRQWEEERIRVWNPGQPYIPPTPPTPPTPAVLEEDFQLGWNAGAYSIETRSGNVALSFKLEASNVGLVVGLSPPEAVPGESYEAIRYGFYIDREQARVIENGAFRSAVQLFESGSTFRIQRVGRTVTYWINDQLVPTSSPMSGQLPASGVPSTEPDLQADSSLYSGMDAVNEAVFSEPVALGIGDASLQPLTGIARALPRGMKGTGVLPWLTGHAEQIPGGRAVDQRLLALTGFAEEGESEFGIGSLSALRGLARGSFGGWGEGLLKPLLSTAEAGGAERTEGFGRLPRLTGEAKGGGVAARADARLEPLTGQGQGLAEPAEPGQGVSRLRPLTGIAGLDLNAGQGDGVLRALSGLGFEDALDEPAIGLGTLLALSGIAAGAQGGRAAGALRPLSGSANADGSAATALGMLLPLVGIAREREPCVGSGSLRPLTGSAWGPTAEGKIAHGFGALPLLRGIARGPLPDSPAHGTGELEPLLGFAREEGLTNRGASIVQRLRALIGFAGVKEGTHGYQLAALQPLVGFAADQLVVRGSGSLQPLTGSGRGGQVQPRRPSWGWVMLMPLTGGARGTMRGPMRGAGSLLPLRGKAFDTPTVWGEGDLGPLTGYGESMPDVFCKRYIPRLLAAASGLRLGAVAASLPIPCNLVVAQPRVRSVHAGTVVRKTNTLLAAASVEVALPGQCTVQAGVAVAKPRRRSARANVWVQRRQAVTASLDIAIE